MPAGYQAIILSMTLTLPLAILPPLYQATTGKHILPERHYVAAVVILITAAIGHLIMYGINTPKIPGVKELIYPVGTIVSLPRALSTEFVYAVVYFSAIVLVYQLIVSWKLGILPITDSTWIQVRGVISALFLEIALVGGMLL